MTLNRLNGPGNEGSGREGVGGQGQSGRTWLATLLSHRDVTRVWLPHLHKVRWTGWARARSRATHTRRGPPRGGTAFPSLPRALRTLLLRSAGRASSRAHLATAPLRPCAASARLRGGRGFNGHSGRGQVARDWVVLGEGPCHICYDNLTAHVLAHPPPSPETQAPRPGARPAPYPLRQRPSALENRR